MTYKRMVVASLGPRHAYSWSHTKRLKYSSYWQWAEGNNLGLTIGFPVWQRSVSCMDPQSWPLLGVHYKEHSKLQYCRVP